MNDLDQLDIMRRAITALGLGQCAPEELVAEAKASSSRREQDRRALSDQRDRIKDLESALRDLGVKPDGDMQGEVRAINNRAAGDSAAAQHDLDCALRERDRAIDDARTAAARVTSRDMRIAELERDLAAKDASLKTAHAALKRICEVVGAPAPCVAEDAVEAVKAYLGTDNDTNNHPKAAKQALKSIVRALDIAGAPQAYTDDGEQHHIPPAERVLLLGERARAEHAERIREGDRADIYRQRLADADLALDACGASRLADGAPLSTAARIRSLPC